MWRGCGGVCVGGKGQWEIIHKEMLAEAKHVLLRKVVDKSLVNGIMNILGRSSKCNVFKSEK